MNIFKNTLLSLLTAGAMLFSPKANALEGIVSNPLTGERLPNQIVKLFQDDVLKDSTRTDENGYYNVNATSVTLPKPNLPSLNPVEYAYLKDLQGRVIAQLNPDQLARDIPRKYDLPSGTYFLQADNGATVQFVTSDKNDISFAPFPRLEERARELEESFKNRNRTSGADEEYTLDVNDDTTNGEIGDFYGRRLKVVDVNRQDFDFEMMYNPEMENIEGMLDLLIFIERRNVIRNGGPYPDTYPRTVFLDSVNCYRHFRNDEKSEMYLRAARNAMSTMRERFDMDDYISEDVDGSLYYIGSPFNSKVIYYNGGSRFDLDSSIVYINDGFPLENENELKNELTHEILHFMGLDDSFNYDHTIMGVDYLYDGITNDDAIAIPWRTKAHNITQLLQFYKN